MVASSLTLYLVVYAVLLTGTATIGIWLWVEGTVGAGVVATALPLAWQIANVAGWVSWEVTGIFENIGVVQEGMQTIAVPHSGVEEKSSDLRLASMVMSIVPRALHAAIARQRGKLVLAPFFQRDAGPILQARGNFLVRQALADQPQHIALTRRQVGERHTRQLRRIDLLHIGQFFDQRPAEPRRILHHLFDGGDQLQLGARILY